MSVSFTLTQRRHPAEMPLNQRFVGALCVVTKETVSIPIVAGASVPAVIMIFIIL